MPAGEQRGAAGEQNSRGWINDDDVRSVIDAADLVSVIGRHVDLKKAGGANFKGLCPFHAERTPSFSVSKDKGLYHCFGCQASGNVITFLKEIEGREFRDSVELLASQQGYQLRYEGGRADGGRAALQRSKNKKMLVLLEAAAGFYHESLRTSKADGAGKARSYLRSRGYEGELLKEIASKYQLGYAPPAPTALADHLREEKLIEDATEFAQLMVEANLAYPPREGSGEPTTAIADRFKDRVMFPIRDKTGAVVGFGGRQLPDGRDPKYLNSAQTPVYDKGRVLYGLDVARRSISADGFVIVCEGYTDVIGFSVAGLENAVATCGTALTESHVELLAGLCDKVLLAFDSDGAGKRAVESYHRWERKFKLNTEVVELAEGQDPGALALDDPDALRAAVESARPLYLFLADRIFERHDITQPTGRERAVDELCAMLAVYPADLLTEGDVGPIAKRIPMGVDSLMERIDVARVALVEREKLEEATRASQAEAGYDPAGYDSSGYGQPPPDAPPPDEYPGDYPGTYPPGYSLDRYASNSATGTGRSKDVTQQPVPEAELKALMAWQQLGEQVAGYIVPEMFDHPKARELFEALSQPEASSDAADDSSKAATSRRQQALEDIHRHAANADLEETECWVSLASAMEAAVRRVAEECILNGTEGIRAGELVQFRDEMSIALLGTDVKEEICDRLEESVEWIIQHRESSPAPPSEASPVPAI